MPAFRPAALCLALALAACGASDLAEPPVPLGDFVLGLNIVVADNVQKVPISRDATVEEWEAVMKKAVDQRFGRYAGNRVYNIGIAVEGYALAPPGIPVVAAPKSILVFTVNVWDDATQTRLNGEGKQFTVFESLSGDTFVGSGLTKTREEQMEALAYNAVKKVEDWFTQHPEWFPPPGSPDLPKPEPEVRKPGTPRPATPAPVAAPAPGPAAAPAPVSPAAVVGAAPAN
jgi:hypothetical protein